MVPNLQQLVQQIALGQPIDIETYLGVFFYENSNHDIGPCTVCGAHGGYLAEQHDPQLCPRASIMVLDDWYEIFKQRESEL